MDDKIISELTSKIRGNELNILDDFCIAFMAAESLKTGKDVVELLGSFVLNQRTIFKNGHMVSQHWLTLKENDH